MEKIKVLINKILSEETINLFTDLFEYRKNKKKVIIWFILLPITIIFLIENFIIYFISFFFYQLIFFFKIFKIKILKKNTKKLILKNRFIFIKNGFLVFIKNIFLEYPKIRAFTNFYIINKKILEKINISKEEKKELIKYIIKIVFNRYLILIIFGLPYIVLYCNTKFTNKLWLIYIIKKREKIVISNFLFSLFMNISCNLMPVSKMWIKKMKIKFFKKGIIFNPGKKIEKLLKEAAEQTKINKQIEILRNNSIFEFVKNKKSENNETGEIKWSKPHIETIFLLNEETGETISVNETSKKMLTNDVENNYYGNCSYRNGDCFITKTIYSKLEFKSLYKQSINYKLKNIDLDKVNYNQILAILLELQNNFIKADSVKENNIITFYFEEKKETLLELIRQNKNNMKNETYEALENSNEFFEKIKQIELNEIGNNENKKVILINNINYYSFIKDKNEIYQILKLK